MEFNNGKKELVNNGENVVVKKDWRHPTDIKMGSNGIGQESLQSFDILCKSVRKNRTRIAT